MTHRATSHTAPDEIEASGPLSDEWGDLRARLAVPALRIALDRWQQSLGSRLLPRFADFDLRGLPREAMVFLQTDPTGAASRRFRVFGVGAALNRRLGEAFPREFETNAQSPPHSMAAIYDRAVSSMAPAYDWARLKINDERLRMDRLILPFSAEGERVTHIAAIVLFDEPSAAEE